MWESPIYTFEKEISENGKIVKKPFYINVTYSAPRNLDDPGKALIGVFNKITEGLNPKNVHILDIGAAKLRNTLWLLEKGFNVYAVEFPELRDRLKDAKDKWDFAEKKYKNFHKVTFPKDFINLDFKFDIILLINEINVMPIPLERFAMLSLCREKIKDNGLLLWHQWRALSNDKDKYTEENEFIDGYLMGNGPNHSFYVEHNKDESHEMLYSVGFSVDKDLNLSKIPSNSCYSYIFKPTHISLIEKSLNFSKLIKQKHEATKIIKDVDKINVLDLYVKQLELIPAGKKTAHQFHLLSSRIFFEIFRNQISEPKIEVEINEGRGRIDFCCRNLNKEGVFKNLKELRDIKCPDIIVECKNYEIDLSNKEYDQLSSRLIPDRSRLGFLICRDKKDAKQVLKHCQDRKKDNKYIVVLDDSDLIQLVKYKLNDEDDDRINEFIDNKIKEIID
jgi:hypothetical protein